MSNQLLESIQIAKPCPANWDDMAGNDRVRFCGLCQKNVYDISRMTRKDAELLVLNTENIQCLRLFRRADGRVLTSDCQESLRRRFLKAAGFALSFAWGWGRVAFAQGATTGEIVVTVVDSTGHRIEEAVVKIVEASETTESARAARGGSGEFIVKELATGEYKILVQVPGFQSWKETVRVAPGATTKVTAELVVGSMGGPEPALKLKRILLMFRKLTGQR